MRGYETKEDEARQKRLRRLARRHGLRLVKGRPMKDYTAEGRPWILDRWKLVREEFDAPELEGGWNDLYGDLDDIENFLTNLPSRDRQDNTIEHPDGNVWAMAD